MPNVDLVVLNGIDWLNQLTPDWREHIDWDTLDQGSCFNCICGQLGGRYGRFVTAWNLTTEEQTNRGFNVPDDCVLANYAPSSDAASEEIVRKSHEYFLALTEAWRRLGRL